jgi:hypothetical protein
LLNLRALTEDAIAFNAAEYIDDLKSRRDLQLGSLHSKFFADIKSVEATTDRPANATRNEYETMNQYEAAMPASGGQSVRGW